MSTVQFFKGTSSKVTSATKQANSFYNDTSNNILYFCDNDKTLHRLNSDTAAKTTSLSWGNSSTIATIDGKHIKVIMPSKPSYMSGMLATSGNVLNPMLRLTGEPSENFINEVQFVGSDGVRIESNSVGNSIIVSGGDLGDRINTLEEKSVPESSTLAVLYSKMANGTPSTPNLYIINVTSYRTNSYDKPICSSTMYLIHPFTSNINFDSNINGSFNYHNYSSKGIIADNTGIVYDCYIKLSNKWVSTSVSEAELYLYIIHPNLSIKESPLMYTKGSSHFNSYITSDGDTTLRATPFYNRCRVVSLPLEGLG